MAITTTFSDESKEVKLAIEGRFDFSLHKEFLDAYANYIEKGSQFKLDLGGVTYIDSSALGMVLLLKDHVSNINGSIVIQRPSDIVYKILEIAQFNRLFKIER